MPVANSTYNFNVNGTRGQTQSPEEAMLLQLAQMGQQLEGQLYGKANQLIDKTGHITDDSIRALMTSGGASVGFGNHLADRYKSEFEHIVNQIIQQAKDYASPGRVRMEMGKYGATAADANEAARQSALRDLKSYGVDPSSGNFDALDKASRLQGAASVASAENQGRAATEAIQRALQSEASQIGLRDQAAAIAALQSGTGALSAAGQIGIGREQGAASLLGLPDQALRTAMSLKYPTGAGSGASVVSGGGRGGGASGEAYIPSSPVGDTGGGTSWDGMQSFNSQPGGISDASGGFGGGMGDAFSSFEEGGEAALPELSDGPTSGGGVPYSASPSMGQETDDIPAHLNAGEFVIPRDVAAWKGQEFFQKLIEQSRQKKTAAPAHPKPGNKPMRGPISFKSQALPLG